MDLSEFGDIVKFVKFISDHKEKFLQIEQDVASIIADAKAAGLFQHVSGLLGTVVSTQAAK